MAAFACLATLALVASAGARDLYVADTADDTVSVFDLETDAVAATLPVGDEPVDVAIAPDASFAYVVNRGDGTVTPIATGGRSVGPALPTGAKPLGIAVSPDGSVLYVTNSADDTVSTISTATLAPTGPPIEVGPEPDGVAFTPDGGAAFVAQRGGGIAVIDTATRTVVEEIADGLSPSRLTIGPRGNRGFVTNRAASSVSAFNPINRNLIGAPIATGAQPAGIEIEPTGAIAYAASPVDGTVTPIDTSLDSVLSLPVTGFPGATDVAFEPRGLRGFVSDGGGSSLTVLDTTRNAPAGSIALGKEPSGLAVVPNRGPTASFFVSPTRRRARKALTFHAAGSIDPDGTIANYAWDFGDGGRAQGAAPTRTHRYRRPGTYTVTLVVSDDEGCSTELVYTGQTAYCTGTPAAVATSTITVLSATGPKVRLRGAVRQRLGRRVKLFAHCLGGPCAFRAHGVLVTSFERGGVVRRARHRLVPTPATGMSRGWPRLVLRLPGGTRRGALRALRRGGKAKARVSVLATDEGGDQSLRTRKIKLVLGG